MSTTPVIFSPFAGEKSSRPGVEWVEAVRQYRRFYWIDFATVSHRGNFGHIELKRNWSVELIDNPPRKSPSRVLVGRYRSADRALLAAVKHEQT
jgi:hypothetical protein